MSETVIEPRQGLSKMGKLKAEVYDVGAEVTLMGESYDGLALAEKTIEATAVIGKKIYDNYRKNRMRKPPVRSIEIKKPSNPDDYNLT